MEKDFLHREVVLQSQEVRDGVNQFKVTIPLEFVKLLGWEKGDEISLGLVLGSGIVSLEKKREVIL